MINAMDICRIVKLLIIGQSSELFAVFVKWHDNTIVHKRIQNGPDAERSCPNDQGVFQIKFWNGIMHLFLDEIHVYPEC
jgi:hypothetical protein